MKKWKTFRVDGKAVRYATGTRPRGNGIQIDFTDKTVTPPLRRQPIWDADPSLQQNANSADVMRDLIVAEIKAAVRGNGGFDLAKHFKNYESRREIETTAAPAEVLLADALEERLQEPHLTPGTSRMYSTIVGEVRSRWPTLALKDITVDLLRDWMHDMKRKGNAIKTIENKIRFIEPTIRKAVRHKLLDENPIDLLDERSDWDPGQKELIRKAAAKKNGGKGKRKLDPFEIPELSKILSKMAGHSNRLAQSANLTKLYLNGPRTGEGFAVAWDDMDFTTGTLLISRSFHNNILGPRKNAKGTSEYEVKLDEQGIAALKAQKIFTYNMPPYKTAEFGDLRFIFRDLETGEPLWTHDKPFRKMWERLLHNACVRYRPPYQLRHTCASIAISCGEPLEWIAKHKLGDLPDTVRRHYAEWFERIAAHSGYVAGARMNDIFKKLGTVTR